jgi:hypothetical protein
MQMQHTAQSVFTFSGSPNFTIVTHLLLSLTALTALTTHNPSPYLQHNTLHSERKPEERTDNNMVVPVHAMEAYGGRQRYEGDLNKSKNKSKHIRHCRTHRCPKNGVIKIMRCREQNVMQVPSAKCQVPSAKCHWRTLANAAMKLRIL